MTCARFRVRRASYFLGVTCNTFENEFEISPPGIFGAAPCPEKAISLNFRATAKPRTLEDAPRRGESNGIS